MRSVLQKVLPLKGFCYGDHTIIGEAVHVRINPDGRCQPRCSRCGRSCPTYDHLPHDRDFAYRPIWGLATFFRYRMRRVNCPHCGIVCEAVPWASGKRQICHQFMTVLAQWSKELSVKTTARLFQTSEHHVRGSIEAVVEYGLENRSLEGVKALGIDEVAWLRRHEYLSLVYQIDEHERRLISVTRNRTDESMKEFVGDMRARKPDFTDGVEVLCTDMWEPYRKIVRREFPNAANVLDRFHIVQKLNRIIDEIRVAEHKEKMAAGDGTLVNARYCFLKNPENLTERQSLKLKELLQLNLKSVKAYLLKEQFQELWKCSSVEKARRFIEKWCRTVLKTELKKMHRFVKMIKRHIEEILNYFRTGKCFSSGVVEGLNRKVNLTIRRAFGFRSFSGIKAALFHQLGDLPIPPLTHRFS